MSKPIEIIAFANGDSTKPSTWSGVPYFLLSAMEEKGIVVHRVNIRLEDKNVVVKYLCKLCNKLIRLSSSKVGGVLNSVDRTSIYSHFVQKNMNKAVLQYASADILLSFDFSHCADGAQKKILLCDWTIEYEITEHQHRVPTHREKINIKRQDAILRKADSIVTLFPNVYDSLKRKYSTACYFGNGINCEEYDDKDIEEIHFKSNRILFIGKPRYKMALITLINAVEKYNASNEDNLEIDVIGMSQDEMASSYVQYHGFLDKGIKEDLLKYEDLMRNANAFVNVNDDWVGAQSLMEAMYYKLPVIINPNRDIYKVYGESIDFGWYCPNDENELCKSLKELRNLTYEEYRIVADSAFRKVESQTWSAFADKLLKTVRQEG